MANKTNSKYKNNLSGKKSKNNKKKTNDISNSRKLSFTLGIASLVVALFLFVAFSSFIFSGAADCANYGNSPDGLSSALSEDGAKVMNACGKWGYLVSVYLVNGGFGIASYFIPLFLILLGLHLIGSYKFNLFKVFVYQCVAMIWISF